MMSRITLNLKREAFRDPDVTMQYSTVVIAGHYEHDAECRGIFGAGTWRPGKQRNTTDFPPGLSLSDFPTTDGTSPPDLPSTPSEDLEDGQRFPEPIVTALTVRDVYELRTLKASPIRPSFS